MSRHSSKGLTALILPRAVVREYRDALSADRWRVPLGAPEFRRLRVERAERALLRAVAESGRG